MKNKTIKLPRSVQLKMYRQEIQEMDISELPHRNAYLEFWNRGENLLPSIEYLSDIVELERRCSHAIVLAERREKIMEELKKWGISMGIAVCFMILFAILWCLITLAVSSSHPYILGSILAFVFFIICARAAIQ